MKRAISIITIVLMVSVIFPFAAGAEMAYGNPQFAVNTAKAAVPILRFWETADPIFTIGFNTIKLNGSITVEGGSLPNIITVISNPNDKKDGVSATMLLRHWTPPKDTTLQIFDKNDKVVTGDTKLATGMKVGVTNAKGEQQTPYTIVVTGNIAGSGKFTLADYVSILNHLTKEKSLTPLQAAAADLNQNDRVDIGDLAMMTGIMLQGT